MLDDEHTNCAQSVCISCPQLGVLILPSNSIVAELFVFEILDIIAKQDRVLAIEAYQIEGMETVLSLSLYCSNNGRGMWSAFVSWMLSIAQPLCLEPAPGI